MAYSIKRNDKISYEAIIMQNKVGYKVYAAFCALFLAVINFYLLFMQEF